MPGGRWIGGRGPSCQAVVPSLGTLPRRPICVEMRPVVLSTLLPLLAMLPGQAPAQPLRAVYEVYAAGMTVLEVEAVLDMREQGYAAVTSLRTRGLASVFLPGEQLTRVEGGWAGTIPAPRRFLAEGTWRGRFRRILLDWQGSEPRIRELLPPNEEEREPVPEALRRGTVDSLSALALLSRTVSESGHCDGAVPVFDGRRRMDYRSRTEGREVIRPWRSAWHGTALRCGFEHRLVAGFRRDQDREEATTPQRGTAWIASPWPGAPAIPVRVEIPNRWFGTATAVLLRAERSDGPVQPVHQRR